jgi:hypothetical protein
MDYGPLSFRPSSTGAPRTQRAERAAYPSAGFAAIMGFIAVFWWEHFTLTDADHRDHHDGPDHGKRQREGSRKFLDTFAEIIRFAPAMNPTTDRSTATKRAMRTTTIP